MNRPEHLIEMIQTGIESVRPSVVLPKVLRSTSDPQLERWLTASQRYLLCIGKASIDSAETILKRFECKDHLVLAPAGTSFVGSLQILFGSHPVPDEKSLQATQKLLSWLEGLPDGSNLLVILSGGASALLVFPADGVSLESKRKVNEMLIHSGAAIQEMNAVRKHLSQVKGGHLGALIPRLHCLVLVISDVIGDDLTSIGSGPFYPDPTTFLDARGILQKHGIWNDVPEDVRAVVESGVNGNKEETPKTIVPPIPHRVIASNRIARVATGVRAEELGYKLKLIEEPVSGPVEDVAFSLSREILQAASGTALICGGEITVRVRGSGTGGRNQHLALLMTEKLQGTRTLFAAAGTDGIDGNSPAAGAWTDGQTLARAVSLQIDYRKCVNTFDSYAFFERLDQTIRTGPTGTNVMDLYVALTED